MSVPSISTALKKGKKEAEMDEDQLHIYSKQLDLLHTKCREMRTAVQCMLEALPNNVTAEELYEAFKTSMVTASAQINEFNSLYNSEESKKALDHAKKSRDANPKGIKPWRAKDHPDWLDLAQ
ncbi:hypothetical protein F5Y04DRAFT_261292 [Hypomontagnella monticulosa]|nr:hypothetical protein F5Y04DRAFT_261292 [Hypomontagnella monticulosa]